MQQSLAAITPAQLQYLIRVGYNPLAVEIMTSYEAHLTISQYRDGTPATLKQVALLSRLGVDIEDARGYSIAEAERQINRRASRAD